MPNCAWCGSPSATRVKVRRGVYADACPEHAERFTPRPEPKPDTSRPKTEPICRVCNREFSWVTVDGRNLRVERFRLHTEPKPGMVCLNPRTGQGKTVKKVNVESVKEWVAAGAELHLLHAASREHQEAERRAKLAEEYADEHLDGAAAHLDSIASG